MHLKRVLFCDDTPIYGGHQATAIAAAQHLASHGVEVVAAVPIANERLRRAWQDRAPAVSLRSIDSKLQRWQPFLAPFGIAAGSMYSVIDDIRPDVVVAVQGTIVQSNRAVEQSLRSGTPVVSFIPMGVHFAPGLWFQALIARQLSRYHYARPDAFITTSEHARRELIDGGARSPIRVVYYGPDLTRLRVQPRKGNASYTLAIIGRVSIGTKGHDVLLHALTRIPDVRLQIVGDGPDDDDVRSLIAQLGLGERVHRVPWQDDMNDVYSSVDMIVIPSRFEGLPLVALEAMFLGLPVVAADVGALREALPQSWLFPAGDAVACADTIQRVRRSDLRQSLSANRERIVNEWNEPHFGRRFHEALEAVVAEGTSSRMIRRSR